MSPKETDRAEEDLVCLGGGAPLDKSLLVAGVHMTVGTMIREDGEVFMVLYVVRSKPVRREGKLAWFRKKDVTGYLLDAPTSQKAADAVVRCALWIKSQM